MATAGPSQAAPLALKVSGALSGCILVSSLAATVGEARQEAARLLDVEDPKIIKIICSGRILQDDSKALSAERVNERSRLLVTKGAAAGAALTAQQQQAERLQQLRTAADKLASRDGRGTTNRYELVLENQDGNALNFSESDRKALIMGLSLHAKGGNSMRAERFKPALDELLLAEEAFSLADPKLLQGIDNYPMLLLDIVWCCYKLQDAGRLATCQERLRKARAGLQAAHGPDLERVRKLHGGLCPELATYVRLETLEGLVAWHMQELGAAKGSLGAALQRWQKLQVSDDHLATLSAMGYKLKAARRALRFCAGDVAGAIDFLAAEAQRKVERREERRKRDVWNRERLKYGRTGSGRFVDGDLLEKLGQLGYDRAVAAEALRQSDNEVQAALDSLADPERHALLLLTMVAQAMEAEHYYGPQQVEQASLDELRRRGYREYYVRHALAKCEGDFDRALRALQDWGEAMTLEVPPPAAGAQAAAGGAAEAAEADGAVEAAEAAGMEVDGAAGAAGGAVAAPPPEPQEAVAAGGGGGGHDDSDGDDEMEREIIGHVAEDPMAAYDVDVAEEGAVIQDLLARIAAAEQQQQQGAGGQG